MAGLQEVLDKLTKDASDHDICAPAVKCKDRKPAIFVMVIRAEDNAPVQGIPVDVSKPTGQNKPSGADGMAKFDPAAVGNHNLKLLFDAKQKRTWVTPAAGAVTTTANHTSTFLFVLQRMPSLEVVVLRSDNRAPLENITVQLTGPESLHGVTAKTTGSTTFDPLTPGNYDVKITLPQDLIHKLSVPAAQKTAVVAATKNKIEILVAPRPKVDPKLKIADPKAVILKRDYMPSAKLGVKVHRLAVTVGVSETFDGTGKLTCNSPAKIKVFDHAEGGSLKAFPIALTTGQLNEGQAGAAHTLYIEAVDVSGAPDDVVLTLELQGGTFVLGPAVHDQLTCVRLKLDICKWRVNHGADPVAIADADKISKGRFVHEQDGIRHERALVILHRAEPDDYRGQMRLQAWDIKSASKSDKLRLFRVEKPATGQATRDLPLDRANWTIPAKGLHIWLEGADVSGAMQDTALRLGLVDVPDKGKDLFEGDRVTVTVIKTSVDICKSKTAPTVEPDPMSTADKTDVGRFIHTQDADFHHGRALAIIKAIEPADFTGQMSLTVWDAAARAAANPRVQLFDQEIHKAGEAARPNPFDFNYNTAFPPGTTGGKGKDMKFWAEGKTGVVSGALRDTEIRLSLTDHIRVVDRVALTVMRFKNFKADVPSTAANTVRPDNTGASNSPVPRHAFTIAAGALDKKDFSESFTENLPLVLVENSIIGAVNANSLILTIETEPAAAPGAVNPAPVLWKTFRDTRPHPDGDADEIVRMSPKPEPTIAQDPTDHLKAYLKADAVGSFRICPYVDCNGDGEFDFNDDKGKRIDREPYIMMNLVLIRAEGFQDNGLAQPWNIQILPPAGQTRANFVGIATSTDPPNAAWTGPNCVWHANGIMTATGGGRNGELGLDKLFAGFIQCIEKLDTGLGYDVGGVPHRQDIFVVTNCPGPPGGFFFVPIGMFNMPPAFTPLPPNSGIAPAVTPTPVLDTAFFPNAGTGGNLAVGTEDATHPGPPPPPPGGIDKKKDGLAVGQHWTVQQWDGPGLQNPPAHHKAFGGVLVEMHYNQDFRSDLCVWTNVTKVAGNTPDAACRLYSTVITNRWHIRFGIGFNVATGAGTITTAANAWRDPAAANRHAKPVEGDGMEARFPNLLNCVAINAQS